MGTCQYQGQELLEGRVVTYEHKKIEQVVAVTRSNHTESHLSSKTRIKYAPELTHVRLVCACGRRYDDGLTKMERELGAFEQQRERKTRTQRSLAADETQCPFQLTFDWQKVPTANGPRLAWVVGNVVAEHEGHVKKTVRTAKLSELQRDKFGKKWWMLA